jgi:sigma-B regulation protein RsbU (phosphoserine phosphatase)
MSIKWKLSIAFILLSLGIVGLYIATAKRTFESDKISYVFDTQQRQVSQLSSDFFDSANRVLFDARAILSGFDAKTKKLSIDADTLFKNHTSIFAIDFRRIGNAEPLVFLEKDDNSGDSISRLAPVADEPGKLSLQSIGDGRFIASITQVTEGGTAILRVVFEFRNFFNGASEDQTLLLAQGDEPMLLSNTTTFDRAKLREFLRDRQTKDVASTMIREIDGKNYLISASPVKIGNFSMLAFMDQATALSALNVLYQRSLVFLAMSFFATVIISLFLSNSLTKNLKDLKRVAERLSQGDLEAKPEFESRDEVGVLAAAFRTMTAEIQKLLLATADKARMESELKTAALVQESLFPSQSQHVAGEFIIGGSYVTSTECGGDWWYYFEKGDFLYVIVADATGHGTPAALITSAARSMFSYIQTKELELEEIASLCDDAIYQCSKGRVYMTALILKIHTRSGLVSYINACHEPPYLWAGEDGSDTRVGDYVVSDPDTMFGETKHNWHRRSLTMKPGEKLIVYTDGVTAVENLEGKTIANRKIGKIFESALKSGSEPFAATTEISRALTDYTQGHPLPDDITLVVIERMKVGAVHAALEEELSVSGLI